MHKSIYRQQTAGKSKLSRSASVRDAPADKTAAQMGNQGLSDYLFSNFSVSSPQDAAERQADRAADAVMSGAVREGQALQTGQGSLFRAAQPETGQTASPGSSTSGVLSHMESAFGHSFQNVHIHTDKQADTLSRSLNADAFTQNNDIYFRQGAYQPGSSEGQHLIAHELAHVVQADGGLHCAPAGTILRAPASGTQLPAAAAPAAASGESEYDRRFQEEPFHTFAEKFTGAKAVFAQAKLINEQNGQVDGLQRASDITGLVGDSVGVIDGMNSIGEDSSKIHGNEKTENGFGVAGKVTGAIGATADTVQAGLDIASAVKDTSASSVASAVGSGLGALGSWVSFGGNVGDSDNAQITGDALGLGSDLIGLGVDSAEVDSARQNVKAMETKRDALIAQAKEKVTDDAKKVDIDNFRKNFLLGKNKKVADCKAEAQRIGEPAYSLLMRATMVNQSCQRADDKRASAGWDVGLDVLGTIGDAFGFASDFFDENSELGSILSIVGSVIGLLVSAGSMARTSIGIDDTKANKSEAPGFAKGVFEQLESNASEAQSAQDAAVRNELILESYDMLDAAGIDLQSFSANMTPGSEAALNKVVQDGYVNG